MSNQVCECGHRKSTHDSELEWCLHGSTLEERESGLHDNDDCPCAMFLPRDNSLRGPDSKE